MILGSVNPIKKFSGFISPWIYPCEWIYSILSKHCIEIRQMSFNVKDFLFSKYNAYSDFPNKGSTNILKSLECPKLINFKIPYPLKLYIVNASSFNKEIFESFLSIFNATFSLSFKFIPS